MPRPEAANGGSLPEEEEEEPENGDARTADSGGPRVERPDRSTESAPDSRERDRRGDREMGDVDETDSEDQPDDETSSGEQVRDPQRGVEGLEDRPDRNGVGEQARDLQDQYLDETPGVDDPDHVRVVWTDEDEGRMQTELTEEGERAHAEHQVQEETGLPEESFDLERDEDGEFRVELVEDEQPEPDDPAVGAPGEIAPPDEQALGPVSRPGVGEADTDAAPGDAGTAVMSGTGDARHPVSRPGAGEDHTEPAPGDAGTAVMSGTDDATIPGPRPGAEDDARRVAPGQEPGRVMTTGDRVPADDARDAAAIGMGLPGTERQPRSGTGEENIADQARGVLEPGTQWWQDTVVDHFGSAEARETTQDISERVPIDPFGVTPENIRQTGERTARFGDPAALGQDIITVGELGVRGAMFAADDPRGAASVVGSAARQAPDAAVAGVETVRDDPGDAAVTGAALIATGGAFGAAARGARGAARVGTDVAQRTRTLDMSGPIQRARRRDVDVTVRRDPDAPRLEIDPRLQQQLRERTSISRPDISAPQVRRRVDDAVARIEDAIPGRPSPDAPVTARDIQIASARAELAVRDVMQRTPTTPGQLRAAGQRARMRADRRFQRTVGQAQFEASRLPGRVRDRATDALPSRPSGPGRPDLDIGVGLGDAARRAGQAVETRQVRARLEADARRAQVEEVLAATPTSAAEVAQVGRSVAARAAPSGPGVREAAETAVMRGQLEVSAAAARAREVSFRPELSAPSAPSLPATGVTDRVSDAVGLAREGTVRIGPARPRRRRVDVGDLEDELGPFADDLVPFDASDAPDVAGATGTSRVGGLRTDAPETDGVRVAPTQATQARGRQEVDLDAPQRRQRPRPDEPEISISPRTVSPDRTVFAGIGAAAGGAAVSPVEEQTDAVGLTTDPGEFVTAEGGLDWGSGVTVDQPPATAEVTREDIDSGRVGPGVGTGVGVTFGTPTTTDVELTTPQPTPQRTRTRPRPRPRHAGRPRPWFPTLGAEDGPEGPSPEGIDEEDLLNPVAGPLDVLGFGGGSGGGIGGGAGAGLRNGNVGVDVSGNPNGNDQLADDIYDGMGRL